MPDPRVAIVFTESSFLHRHIDGFQDGEMQMRGTVQSRREMGDLFVIPRPVKILSVEAIGVAITDSLFYEGFRITFWGNLQNKIT